MKKITVVFPMAGEGQRFGNKFKPFLKIFNKTFIELAVEPFLKHKNEIEWFVFIVREDHQKQFDVCGKINSLNLPIKYDIEYVFIDPTNNVIETISTLFDGRKSLSDVIFCDCDHWLNVDSLFEEIQKDKFDCIIPGWPIKPREVDNWSVASYDKFYRYDMGYKVLAISEKAIPRDGTYMGVIGCYYFRRLYKPSAGFTHLSDVISYFITDNKLVKLIEAKEAEFFGDPERLENLYISKKASTIFCDLDGTIIEHENIPDYSKGIKLLDGAKETIDQWRKNSAFIVLTTSRDEQFRPEMERMLRNTGIAYEYFVMGLPPGPRYLINDKKPYSDVQMAKSIEVERNIGIKSIGHSFASFGIKNETGYKTLPADINEHQLKKFKAQYDSMWDIGEIPVIGSLVPKVSNFTGRGYDIDYLKGYRGIHCFPQKQRIEILKRLFSILPDLYDYVKYDGDISWLHNFINEKVFSRKQVLKDLQLDTEIFIRIQHLFSSKYNSLRPLYLSRYFHGDMTYENVMVNGEDIKFIDLDNENKPGPPELDMGKLMQSILTDYEHWDENIHSLNAQDDFDTVIDFYTAFLKQPREQVINKAYFYCVIHLIRMIPYQAKTSPRRAKIAHYWAGVILSRIKWNTSIRTL